MRERCLLDRGDRQEVGKAGLGIQKEFHVAADPGRPAYSMLRSTGVPDGLWQ